ncbi:MAG: metalloregulator ArsR/SmtB family transcription factor [Candidatus Cloacimonetes bacterium]|nr:metalloregulator ArsR/SmtB family transcription factor [Candidatus Cloacimonadota bacterium]MDD3144276.1 metalloregulator ArsR/SmtB family transcription factor [Candidatus Cloacimonadota bacterium]
MSPNDARYTTMAAILKAMAHPTRLFILDRLQEQDHCVCELQELIGADMSTVSKHLSVLKNTGIITSRKYNNQVIHSLLCPCVLDMYKCVTELKQKQGGPQ